jgi:hypothetical protein
VILCGIPHKNAKRTKGEDDRKIGDRKISNNITEALTTGDGKHRLVDLQRLTLAFSEKAAERAEKERT